MIVCHGFLNGPFFVSHFEPSIITDHNRPPPPLSFVQMIADKASYGTSLSHIYLVTMSLDHESWIVIGQWTAASTASLAII